VRSVKIDDTPIIIHYIPVVEVERVWAATTTRGRIGEPGGVISPNVGTWESIEAVVVGDKGNGGGRDFDIGIALGVETECEGDNSDPSLSLPLLFLELALVPEGLSIDEIVVADSGDGLGGE
jgi:hypothetical protein